MAETKRGRTYRRRPRRRLRKYADRRPAGGMSRDRAAERHLSPRSVRASGYEHAPFEHASAVEDPCTIVDSWIVLHETLFADHEPPSQGFVQESDQSSANWSRVRWTGSSVGHPAPASSPKRSTCLRCSSSYPPLCLEEETVSMALDRYCETQTRARQELLSEFAQEIRLGR